MTRSPNWPGRLLAAALSLAPLCARADGLADLKAALARLQAQAPLHASLDVKTLERHGDGPDLDEKIGQANLALDDGARGVQLTLPRDTLARMEVESQALARDPEARTPTLWALARFDAAEAPAMASGAAEIAHLLDEAQPTGEKVEAWQGRPARRLTFSLPVTHLTKIQRKYVKKFDGSYDVWIAADGTPLASAVREAGSGRAFIVITFESRRDEDCTYGVVGDRLVTLRRETHDVGSGAGERGESRVVRTLQLLP